MEGMVHPTASPYLTLESNLPRDWDSRTKVEVVHPMSYTTNSIVQDLQIDSNHGKKIHTQSTEETAKRVFFTKKFLNICSKK